MPTVNVETVGQIGHEENGFGRHETEKVTASLKDDEMVVDHQHFHWIACISSATPGEGPDSPFHVGAEGVDVIVNCEFVTRDTRSGDCAVGL